MGLFAGFAEGTEYTFGRKPTTRLLKVQNLSKVEDTLMDTLSSQDFDEVRHEPLLPWIFFAYWERFLTCASLDCVLSRF